MASGLLLSTATPAEFISRPPLFRVQLGILLFLLPLALYLIHFIRKDYHAFLALGPGGTPSTPAGYLRICILRLITLHNPLAPPSLPSALHPQHGFLLPSTLPPRHGPRPTVAGIAPQRQMTQKSSAAMYSTLTDEIHRLTHGNPHSLYTATSCFEKHSTGIFCRSVVTENTSAALLLQQPQRKLRVTCNGEVCHSHPSDGSLHLTLHPADVKLVLERGWGQRHPLARDSWWWWTRIVPAGFVMVYAPRDAEELESVVEIIRAAAWWVSGEEMK